LLQKINGGLRQEKKKKSQPPDSKTRKRYNRTETSESGQGRGGVGPFLEGHPEPSCSKKKGGKGTRLERANVKTEEEFLRHSLGGNPTKLGPDARD